MLDLECLPLRVKRTYLGLRRMWTFETHNRRRSESTHNNWTNSEIRCAPDVRHFLELWTGNGFALAEPRASGEQGTAWDVYYG
jgi:hypothetical protein